MPSEVSASPRLVADIGGTNARFALLAADGSLHEAQTLRCAEHADPVAAVEHYLASPGRPRPREAALALATAITGDQVKMTNHVWSFSLEATRQQLGLERLIAVNDFTALALALPGLDNTMVSKVGPGEPRADRPIALLGPGTGLGVSGLIPAGDVWVPLEGEGGHVTFSPADEQQVEILRIIRRERPHVSAEALLCGSGLVRLYQAICKLESVEEKAYTPADITERGLAGSDTLCQQVLHTFCAMLGTVAGNLALTLGAQGGVYIGGGIIPRLGAFFHTSPFRQQFEHKGRFSGYLATVPSYVITVTNPAFLGLARAFDEGKGHTIRR